MSHIVNQEINSIPILKVHSTVKQHKFLNLQERYWVLFLLWSRSCYSDCDRSRPGNENMFLRISYASLHLVVISKTRLFEPPVSASSKYQPAKNFGDAGWSIFNCRRKRHGQKRVSGVWSGRYLNTREYRLTSDWLEKKGCRCCRRWISKPLTNPHDFFC